jgi:hypothetical protein
MGIKQLRQLVARIGNKFRNLGSKSKLPTLPDEDLIDREYIEGETTDEIGKIGEMRGIPDKADRHVPVRPEEREAS